MPEWSPRDAVLLERVLFARSTPCTPGHESGLDRGAAPARRAAPTDLSAPARRWPRAPAAPARAQRGDHQGRPRSSADACSRRPTRAPCTSRTAPSSLASPTTPSSRPPPPPRSATSRARGSHPRPRRSSLHRLADQPDAPPTATRRPRLAACAVASTTPARCSPGSPAAGRAGRLLGYPTMAYVVADQIAAPRLRSPTMLDAMAAPAMRNPERERAEIEAAMRADGVDGPSRRGTGPTTPSKVRKAETYDVDTARCGLTSSPTGCCATGSSSPPKLYGLRSPSGTTCRRTTPTCGPSRCGTRTAAPSAFPLDLYARDSKRAAPG